MTDGDTWTFGAHTLLCDRPVTPRIDKQALALTADVTLDALALGAVDFVTKPKVDLAYKLEDVPVWAFHGAKDDVVPLRETKKMADAVREAGGDALLTVYPDAGHDAWTVTYDNPKLYEWFLAHKTPPRRRPKPSGEALDER